MALPTLESMTAKLDRVCADVLGETIQYAADGEVFSSVQAHPNYRDAQRAYDISDLIAQDISLSILKVDLLAKPNSTVRLRLPKAPGKTFRPINVRTDESGTGWEFEVQIVPDA